MRVTARRIMLLAAMLVIWSMAATAREKVGLVLSGGGAKGIAHIGVIKALEDNDIPIDYITGTSMGAIVGGLYASGYSPEEMMELLLSKPFSYWSTGRIDPNLRYYFLTEPQSPAMLYVPITTKGDSLQQVREAVPASLISPLPMSFAFMQLFTAYNAQCGSDFDKLFVPFRCVASDTEARHKVVLSKGDFADAVRSSMSFPIVFQPTRFDGMLLYDGGIYDNFPADVMKETFHPDFVIGVDVSTIEKGPQTSLIDQIENLVMQGSSYYLDPSNGIKIKFDLNEFGLLDFPQAREIYRIGYDKGMSMVDSIKSRVSARAPEAEVHRRRDLFKQQTPQVRFSEVEVTGAPQNQNKYIAYMFNRGCCDTLSLDQARNAYYRAISSGQLRDLQPHAYYNDSTGLFRLNLKASVKDDIRLGLGGYITSALTSYVYLSARYSTFSFKSLSAGVDAWLGQSYQGVTLNGRVNLPTHNGNAIGLQGVAFRQNFYHDDITFFNYRQPSFVHKNEVYGRLKWMMAAGQLGKLEAGFGYGRIHDSFYEPILSDGFTPFRDRCRFLLGQFIVKYESNTLNDINYPVQGRYYRFTGLAVAGSYKQHGGEDGETTSTAKPKWVQLESVTRNYVPVSRHFSLGVETDVMLSTRKLVRDYNTSIVTAPGYNPTPASYNYFSPCFRANSFIAGALVPVYRYNDNFSARLTLSGFLPIRKIESTPDGRAEFKRRWFTDPQIFTEFSLAYSLPFATVSAYANYASARANNWNVGISFGIFVLAPEFLRK